MWQMFTEPSLEILLIAGRFIAPCLALVVFAWGFRHWRCAASKDAQRVFEQLDLVRSELLIMREAMHNAAHRVDSMAQRVAHEARLAPATTGTARGYEMAGRMARNGGSKDELMKSCGLTSHEAELLIKLHSKPVASTDLLSRQPRPAQPQPQAAKAPANAAAIARQPIAAPVTQSTVRPTKTAPAPAVRAPQPRSRLVAVG